jgi:uncharacterized protein (DUF1501 family)
MTSRRVFLRNGGLALVSLGFAPAFLGRTAFAAGSARRKLLVAVFQRGAVDGLNMVVPFGERRYYALRPTIAIARPGSGERASLDLDGFFALHPRLAPLKPFYDSGQLAIVHATGSPDSTRSHFDAQDYMESGTPGVKSTDDGWLNRTLRAKRLEEETPFRAVALAPTLPRSLQGKAPALAIGQIGQFGVRDGSAGMVSTSFEQQYAAAADQVLKGTGQEAFDAIRMLERANPQRYRPAPGVDYPRSAFGQALLQIAQLAKADVGLEIAFAETGQWDHHVNEGGAEGQLAQRLDDFGRGLAALARDLGDRMAATVIVTMSEFGRAVAENGNRGTDHGHGNAMFVMGAGVKGGKVYGRWPGLEREQQFEGRDLAITTDFRDVFTEVVTRHLGVVDPGPIFPGYALKPTNRRGFMG